VDVRLWKIAEYHDQESRLPGLIDPEWIHGHVALTTVSLFEGDQKAWATIDLAKVSLSFIFDTKVTTQSRFEFSSDAGTLVLGISTSITSPDSVTLSLSVSS
jgi:hypothetical protein